MILEKEAVETDEAAFNSMVQLHYDTMMRTAIRLTGHQQSAEDIVQETFLKLWKNRTVIVPQNIAGWLYTVTTHHAYKHLKKVKRNRIHAKLNTVQKYWHTDVEDRLLLKEKQHTHETAYMRLPQRQKIVYTLSREQGLSRDEIAFKLNISPNTVKNHLLKAIQFMKGHFQTSGLLVAFLIFHNLFFISNSTEPSLRDLDTREKKVNKKSEIEEVYTKMYGYAIVDLKQKQHAFYFKNNEPFAQIQQLMGNPRYRYRD